jgi:imidazole glycerol phosphate synthase subunit HisF
MDNGMIRKYQKAKRYAEQRDRIQINAMKVSFDGRNNPHNVELKKGKWQCDCEFFQLNKRCSHTMALEIILDDMVPQAA